MEAPAASRRRTRTIDRLSDLPDCILEDVLLRLTSQQAMQTSALSRRWRNLWRAVTCRCIDIDQHEFSTPETTSAPVVVDPADIHAYRRHAMLEKLHRETEHRRKFEELADRLTLLHDAPPPPPPDTTFRLRVNCEDFRAAHRWIHRRLRRRPAAFHLRCGNDTGYALYSDKWPHFPDLILPYPHAGAFTCRLRALRLAGLTLSGSSMDALTAESPVLEDVHLEDCRYGFRRLASRSLKKLLIDRRCITEYNVDTLVLAVPRVASLRIHGYSPPVAAEVEMPFLVAASLRARAGDNGILRSLREARSLDLTGFSTTALPDDEEPVEFPVFRNLRNLLLDECDVGVECQVLRRFLRSSPSLETLTLRNCTFLGGSTSRKRKRTCFSYPCKNLKSIELEFNEGHAVRQLADALSDISKEVVHPIQVSVQNGKRRAKISYT